MDETPLHQNEGERDAPFEFAGLLDAAIDRQRQSAVSDLSELEFMKAGARTETDIAEERLGALGIRLTTPLPSALVNRLISLMEMGELPDAPAVVTQHPSGREGSISVLRTVTAMPADPDVVDGALRLVVKLARTLVNGADGVSVSLLRHGRLSTVAASDQTIMDMDTDQYATGEGPCVDASLKGRSFHAAVLASETRWPAFTPQALGLGINSILSSPLKASDKPVGALNIYSRAPLAFDTKDQATATAFAEQASVILSDAGAGATDDQIALRYQDALQSRRVITLATGVIMEREGIDQDEAFTALLRLSLYHGETLRSRAETMVVSCKQSRRRPASGSHE
jgi:hypothetical protein